METPQDRPPASHRLPWRSAPGALVTAIERLVGSAVVEAADLTGGYGPAIAARLSLADGRRVFVKATETAGNPQTLELCRAEARITPALPDGAPAPRMLGSIDGDGWFALVLEYIDGHMPSLPWRAAELALMVAATDGLAPRLAGIAVTLPAVGDWLGRALSAAARMAAAPPSGLDAWTLRHRPEMAEVAAGWTDAAAGDDVLHCDIRADNALITGDGEVVFVDWAHVSRGQAWFDVVALAPSVALQGGPPPDDLLAMSALGRRAPEAAVTSVVVALAAFFTEGGLLPDPPGLPTLRRFQREQAEVARRWAATRTGWR